MKPKPAKPKTPSFELEDSIGGLVCGLDEVGRGPLAGPVYAACVLIRAEIRHAPFLGEIRDSKKLSKGKLEDLHRMISENCDWGIGACTPEEIDEMNILQASLCAMKRAFNVIQEKGIVPDHALVDGNRLPTSLTCPATAVIRGDSHSISIAAASILAKVERDKAMRGLSQQWPQYGWGENAGYPTKAHLEAINLHGITPYHRKSFAPVRNFLLYGETKAQTRFAL